MNRLPSSPLLLKRVIYLEGIRNADEKDKNWELLFDKISKHKLLYSLTLMEYLMEDKEEENVEEQKEVKDQTDQQV